jgi:hypothetical protein
MLIYQTELGKTTYNIVSVLSRDGNHSAALL